MLSQPQLPPTSTVRDRVCFVGEPAFDPAAGGVHAGDVARRLLDNVAASARARFEEGHLADERALFAPLDLRSIARISLHFREANERLERRTGLHLPVVESATLARCLRADLGFHREASAGRRVTREADRLAHAFPSTAVEVR